MTKLYEKTTTHRISILNWGKKINFSSFKVFLCIFLLLHSSFTVGERLPKPRRKPSKDILKHFEPTRKPVLGVDPNWVLNRTYYKIDRVTPPPTMPDVTPSPTPKKEKRQLTVGIVLPKSNFRRRDYYKEIVKSIEKFQENSNATSLSKYYDFNIGNVVINYMESSSSPKSK